MNKNIKIRETISIKITWLGHSSFLMEDSEGIKVLTDPFDNTVGYPVYRENCDVVTISHYHFDHDYTKEIKGKYELIDKTGHYNINGIDITGMPSYHDKVKGAKRGENIIYIFKIDDYRICHLGDLGYVLNEDEIRRVGNVDVLFVPVGGNFTIDGKEAANVTKLLKPHIVIPMHYMTPQLKLELDGAETFIKYMKNSEKINSCQIEINEKLKEYDKVKILQYKK